MGRMTITVGLNEARDLAVVEARESGGAGAHMTLDAAAVEGFIRQLGRVRSQMTEIVAPELEPKARIDFESSPAWRVTGEHSGPPGIVLALRHPGLGWLGFLLEAKRARAIGKALAKTAVSQRSPST